MLRYMGGDDSGRASMDDGVMFTIEWPSGQPSLADAGRVLKVQESDLDRSFGIVLIDPGTNEYTGPVSKPGLRVRGPARSRRQRVILESRDRGIRAARAPLTQDPGACVPGAAVSAGRRRSTGARCAPYRRSRSMASGVTSTPARESAERELLRLPAATKPGGRSGARAPGGCR
jgi:hypothetical protein